LEPIKFVRKDFFVLPCKRQSIDYLKPKRPHRGLKRLVARSVGVAQQKSQKLPSTRCFERSEKIFKKKTK
ncbi:MAG: hypothetical protein LH609_20520, partial [Rudanella sp.]|nr:hypothetical protein [Rudanella sp.]